MKSAAIESSERVSLRLWNALPGSITECKSVGAFKNASRHICLNLHLIRWNLCSYIFLSCKAHEKGLLDRGLYKCIIIIIIIQCCVRILLEGLLDESVVSTLFFSAVVRGSLSTSIDIVCIGIFAAFLTRNTTLMHNNWHDLTLMS